MVDFARMKPETLERWGWLPIPAEATEATIILIVGSYCYETLTLDSRHYARRYE
jgi:hypothetical protein